MTQYGFSCHSRLGHQWSEWRDGNEGHDLRYCTNPGCNVAQSYSVCDGHTLYFRQRSIDRATGT